MPEFTAPGGRFTARAVDAKFLIEWAYGILPMQHSDGPAWLGNDRYDIVAKAAGSASDAEMRRMLQALLADRFQLKVHRETRELSALVISLGKTAPKISPVQENEKRALKVIPQGGGDQNIPSFHVVGTRFSFEQFNTTFSRRLGKLLVDQTGYHDEFDFEIDLTPHEAGASPLDPSTLISAMRDQLGLVVKSQKAPVEYLVIDGIEKVAAGN